jgi:hypothetical protein
MGCFDMFGIFLTTRHAKSFSKSCAIRQNARYADIRRVYSIKEITVKTVKSAIEFTISGLRAELAVESFWTKT